jgi:hypothetical protein
MSSSRYCLIAREVSRYCLFHFTKKELITKIDSFLWYVSLGLADDLQIYVHKMNFFIYQTYLKQIIMLI